MVTLHACIKLPLSGTVAIIILLFDVLKQDHWVANFHTQLITFSGTSKRFYPYFGGNIIVINRDYYKVSSQGRDYGRCATECISLVVYV